WFPARDPRALQGGRLRPTTDLCLHPYYPKGCDLNGVEPQEELSVYRLLRAFGLDPGLSSFVCQSKHFDSNWYRRWALKIAKGDPDINRFGPNFAQTFAKVWDAMAFDGSSPLYRHRKMWEWCAISHALEVRGMFAPGRRGCGFAVGHEPLPSLFASLGADIL